MSTMEANESCNVLIVDDDPDFAAMLADYLRRERFVVEIAGDGASGLAAALEEAPDIIILDVMLPVLSGTEVLSQLRKKAETPVLMLTARGDDVDRIVGLELGADDYLPKPCNPREVVARLRAILRRYQASTGSHEPSAFVEIGPLRLDTAGRSAYCNDQLLDLTSTEFSILEVLMRSAGSIVSKEQLSQLALGRPLGRYDRSVDMHISHLRKKLAATGNQDLIETIRGRGYQLLLTTTNLTNETPIA